MTEEQIKHLVVRFLGWRLPDTFRPDNGISFKAPEEERFRAAHWPSGTNLFDYDQAKAMVLHMLEGLPAGDGVTVTFSAAEEAETDPLTQAAAEALAEARSAAEAWPPFNSAHEGFAVLLEEVDELKAHVWTKQKNRDLGDMRDEALQVAAMGIRFAVDVCDEARGRK